jgi:hypothetical protein
MKPFIHKLWARFVIPFFIRYAKFVWDETDLQLRTRAETVLRVFDYIIPPAWYAVDIQAHLYMPGASVCLSNRSSSTIECPCVCVCVCVFR